MCPPRQELLRYLAGASDKLSDEYLIADNHLCLGNFAGLPSITLPLCYEKGMPIGINFMGRAFEEKKLFQLASAFERLSGLAETSAIDPKEAAL
jgi:aspartyl-tRNA(Asn)/glutamyl-tRNA(Gln) amidotransferase subunit A